MLPVYVMWHRLLESLQLLTTRTDAHVKPAEIVGRVVSKIALRILKVRRRLLTHMAFFVIFISVQRQRRNRGPYVSVCEMAFLFQP
jgi:hypothetical protein